MMRKKEQQNERTLISIKIGASDITLAPTLEVPPRFELGVELLQSSALPLGYVAVWITGVNRCSCYHLYGAGDEARTRYLHLGKVALYQMSYTCMP